MHIKDTIVSDLKGRLPQFEKDNNTATSIRNAWEKSIYLDNGSGALYVNVECLHTILRMQRKLDAHYLVERQLPARCKLEINDELYIATDEVMGILNRRMVGADPRKRSYIKYSEDLLITIREMPEVRLKQEDIRRLEEDLIKQLKKKRMKQLNITKDELTNKKLVKKTAEFSHIRKKSNYRMYACSIYNGLVVNKDIHDCITKENIQDEEELLELCLKMKWNTDWYKQYSEMFA